MLQFWVYILQYLSYPSSPQNSDFTSLNIFFLPHNKKCNSELNLTIQIYILKFWPFLNIMQFGFFI